MQSFAFELPRHFRWSIQTHIHTPELNLALTFSICGDQQCMFLLSMSLWPSADYWTNKKRQKQQIILHDADFSPEGNSKYPRWRKYPGWNRIRSFSIQPAAWLTAALSSTAHQWALNNNDIRNKAEKPHRWQYNLLMIMWLCLWSWCAARSHM